ncbi:GNAT family N-acetyltransferase [Vibrio casei]|uniref:GNAT family N-acetyltransferase n=1 Tax=Vibrio casei TaxID=673372 RepID=UPI0013A5F8E3|nr:GNAT family N-acetyltransferase [Vibrio casei]
MQELIDKDGKISRSTFLQKAPIWHLQQAETDNTMHTAANGISHPTRPKKPVGQVFQRYCYHLKRTLTFRVIDIERDLAIFNQWHNHPIIHPVWELEGSLSMHREYLEKLDQDPHQFAVIGEFDGVPFGYFEVYWTPEDRLGPYYDHQAFDRGIHILVGNFDYRGGTFFDAWGKSIFHYCFVSEPQTMRLFGEPNAKNHRVVKITERIGMQKQFEFDFLHKRAALLQCDRERFFQHIIF